MTYRIEKLCKVYSPRFGDQLVWRPSRSSPGLPILEWDTEREAAAFADLFIKAPRDEVRVVKVEKENA